MPYLWLTCDYFVGKVSAMGQPTRPTQPSIPLGLVNEYSNPWITGVEIIKRQTRAAYGCLVADNSPVVAGLACSLQARSVCDTTAPLQLQQPIVTLYRCYAFTFIYIIGLLRSCRRECGSTRSCRKFCGWSSPRPTRR